MDKKKKQTDLFDERSQQVSERFIDNEKQIPLQISEKGLKSHVYSMRQDFSKRVIYTDRPTYEKRSNNLARESWSYHSLFPSLRTYIPLFALPLATIPISWLGIQFDSVVISALWTLFNVAVGISIIFFFAEMTKHSVSHAIKDGMINITIFGLLLFFNASRGIEIAIKVFLLYLGGHILLHAVDFHVERTAKTRATTNFTIGGFLVCIELFLAVGLFDTSLII